MTATFLMVLLVSLIAGGSFYLGRRGPSDLDFNSDQIYNDWMKKIADIQNTLSSVTARRLSRTVPRVQQQPRQQQPQLPKQQQKRKRVH